MTNDNLILVKGGAYDDLKRALRQWIDLYSKDLQDGLSFKLYKNGAGNHVIHADKRLDNQSFYFLVNYLKYPTELNYKIEIEGFTMGKEDNILKNKKLLVYISPSDKDFDNVLIATDDRKNYKVDFGGKIVEVSEIKQYILKDINHLDNPDILKVNRQEYKLKEDKKSIKSIDKRFKIISLITLIACTINFLLPLFPNGIDIFEKTTWITYIGVGFWFLADVEMLRIKNYYIKSLFIAIGVVLYGYLIKGFIQNGDSAKLLLPTSLFPLAILIVQWPTRRIYKFIFKREPELDKTGKFADFVYSMILMFGSIILPFLINDWIKGE